MKRAFIILWRIVAIIVLFGGFIYSVFYASQDWVVAIWWGACIVLNLPMVFGKFVFNDGYKTNTAMVLGAILAFLIAPILLLIKIITSFKRGGGSVRRNPSSDTRDIDGGIVTSALQKEIKNAVYSASKPSGYYVDFQSVKNISPLIYFGQIEVTGTLVYSLRYTEDVDGIKRDLESCLKRANNNIANEVLKAVERVRDKYRNYDNEWRIKVDFRGEVQ